MCEEREEGGQVRWEGVRGGDNRGVGARCIT